MIQCKLRVALKKKNSCWVPVAHACNPSYLRGSDQEDCGSKLTGLIV
jgi:hypothetical protein